MVKNTIYKVLRPLNGIHVPPPCCFLEQDTFTPRKVVVIPKKWWLRPDMTEKIVDWDVKPQQNQTKTIVWEV